MRDGRGRQFDDRKADILKYGLTTPVATYHGEVLDVRHWLRGRQLSDRSALLSDNVLYRIAVGASQGAGYDLAI